MTPATVTVHELVQSIRQLVEGVPQWQRVWVKGELSGVKHHSSGHWYFILKDDQAQLRGVMFRRDAASLTAPLRDGLSVLAFGRVGVFERDGQTQFYVAIVQEAGDGDQFQKLEALKKKLAMEGLFSSPKRALPRLPRAVGVITSGTGAARFDIETVIRRRFPSMPVRLFPVLVQGPEAPRAIVRALQEAYQDRIDVLIVGRGGGSKEDLMAFNDEAVVRMVAASPVPVISAVGHEIDTTLVDLVADMRAPTPSAAAELAVPERASLIQGLNLLSQRIHGAMRHRIEWERSRLAGWTAHGILTDSGRIVGRRRDVLDRLEERRDRAMERRVQISRARLDRLTAGLDALNPSAVLARGYTYLTDTQGKARDLADIRPGEHYEIHWYNGSYWMISEKPGKEDEA
ncbi:exodeoxyribonuclease VII large subunit [Sulfobacillus sp. hq2]|uniref:Exodeoxyribonuclease 7 large subunit n=1 Tax=Sulfobacillus thermotolerans TaxID=338644 RepID=A0ABN5GYC3_9FIRM|nr:exodeoxyribonuclease VII large subunit [Sulfobacillus sp. hq2]AUW93525.1 exodeoxyribonuclease VII large subunit [Sulfobacillus thermotolerans]POB10768.1 exodeoxyribonuclease VII large subunit [Sulfobacillus sp. hq2]